MTLLTGEIADAFSRVPDAVCSLLAAPACAHPGPFVRAPGGLQLAHSPSSVAHRCSVAPLSPPAPPDGSLTQHLAACQIFKGDRQETPGRARPGSE